MAHGNERPRDEPAKSKSKQFMAIGQSLRRGLTTRRSNKASRQTAASSTDPAAPEAQTVPVAGDHRQQGTTGMHATLPKSSYTPSPLSRGGIPSVSSGTASLGLSSGASAAVAGSNGSANNNNSRIYGKGRMQRIASASGAHHSGSQSSTSGSTAGPANTSGGSTHFRKTLYGSTALAGMSKSGFSSSNQSLPGTGAGTSGTAASGGAAGSTKADGQTIGRKGGPPPEPVSGNGPHNNSNRDYSFAIANNHASIAAQSARSSAGASLSVAKEGYLSKKTDINPSTSLASALSRGWKVYRVVLKGAKLFFYKPPSESELREMFPEEIAAASNETAGGYFRSSMSVSGYEDVSSGANAAGFPMAPGEVESGSRAIMFEPGVRDGEITVPLCERYTFGECFTEVDLRTLKFKRYVCVLIFDDTIVVLKRRWVRQGLASSFFGAVSNKMRFGKSARAKAHQQHADNTSLVSAELGITGKGYFTKWKYHSQYPLSNVEAIEAASSRFSVSHSPGVLGHLGRESQAGSGRLSLYSIGNSSVSSVMTRTSTVSKDYSGALSSGLVPGFQIFVSGKERVARMFVATTSDAKNNWLSRFAAAKASYARRLRQRDNPSDGRRYNPTGGNDTARATAGTAGRDTGAETTQSEEKSKPAKDTRTRLYWGMQRHPELVVAESDVAESSDAQAKGSEDQTTSSGTHASSSDAENSAVVVVGGSVSALVHEMVFRTTEKTSDAAGSGKHSDAGTFAQQLASTYPLVMSHSEFLAEFQRYAGLVVPEEEGYKKLAAGLGETIRELAALYSHLYNAEQIAVLRAIVEKSIASEVLGDEAAVAAAIAAIDGMEPAVAAAQSEEPAKGQGSGAQADLLSPGSNLESYEIIGTLPTGPTTKASIDSGARTMRGRSKTHHGEPEPSVAQIPGVPELVRVEITGLTPSLLLRVAPEELAHQLYLFHKSQLTAFDPKIARLYTPKQPGTQRFDGGAAQHTTPSLLTVGTGAEGDSAARQQADDSACAGAEPDAATSDAAALDVQRQLMAFTPNEPHFLTRLIHHQLLVELPLNRPTRRSALLQHWVRIGESSRAIGDAVAWAAIAMAVTMAPVARLRETWHGVGLQWCELVVAQWIPLLVRHGIYEADIAAPDDNRPLVLRPLSRGNAAGAECAHAATPFTTPAAALAYAYTAIPYYGPIRMRISRLGRRLQRQYSSTLATAGGSGDPSDRVLFAHIGHMHAAAHAAAAGIPSSLIARARTGIMRSRASSLSLAATFQHDGDAVQGGGLAVTDPAMLGHAPLQAYLRGLALNPQKIGNELALTDVAEYDERLLQSLSLQCEPSVADQYQQHVPPSTSGADDTAAEQAAALRQAPGAILPLVCPETVPSTNILQWITPAARSPATTAAAASAAAHTSNRADTPSGRAGTFSHAPTAEGAEAAPQQQSQQPLRHKRSRSFPTADAGEQLGDAQLAGATVHAANGELALRVLRVQSGTDGTPRLVVEVQGATVPILLDLLIRGIEHFGNAGLVDDAGASIGTPVLVFNRDVFQRTFMASFRHFCSGLDVIDAMRRALVQASGVDAEAQLAALLDVSENWLAQHLGDFLDSAALRDAMAGCAQELAATVRRHAAADSSGTWPALVARADMLVSDLVAQLLAPGGDAGLARVLERRLAGASSRERRTAGRGTAAQVQLETPTRAPLAQLSVASPDTVLEALNRLAQTHFARCSFNDWLVAFCLLEVQTYAPLPWYARKRTSHVPPEDDLIISDIYQVLEQTQRGRGALLGVAAGGVGTADSSAIAATAETSLVRSLPRSIQAMLELHRSIRGWVVRQIADPAASRVQRVARIQKFLALVRLCRRDSPLSTSRVFGGLLNGYMREAGMIPERQPSYRATAAASAATRYAVGSRATGEQGRRGRRKGAHAQAKYVPSFVERAVASALVSPESRLFTRAWSDVAAENGTKLDTLEAVLRGARDWGTLSQAGDSGVDTKAAKVSNSASGPDPAAEPDSAAEPNSPLEPNPAPFAIQRSRSNPAADSLDVSDESMARADCFVPCLGWLLENMVSLCYDTPDSLTSDARLVNVAKRHRVYIMLCVCDQLATRCQEAFALPTTIRIDASQLAAWVAQAPLRVPDIRSASQSEATETVGGQLAEVAGVANNSAAAAPNGVVASQSSGFAGDRSFTFSAPAPHNGPGFVRSGDAMAPQTLRHAHTGGFAKRSIANLRGSAANGAGTIGTGESRGSYARKSSVTASHPTPDFAAGQVFGSPPAPAPRSLAYADGPHVPPPPGGSASAGSAGPAAAAVAVYGRPFARLVTDEIEKVRQEIRERERLERELRDHELAIERQKQERTKILKRQLKEQQQRRAKTEPLLKMASLMNKVGIGARDSSIDSTHSSAHSTATNAVGASAASNRLSASDAKRPRGPALPSAKPANVINLINSTITIEQAYTKRDHVFRIVTEEGGQYLLQAPELDQMDDWISAMRDAATEAAARRLTLFVEEAKKRNNGSSSNNADGIAASSAMGDSDAPLHSQYQPQQQSHRHIGGETTRSRFTAFLGGGSSAFGALNMSQAPPAPNRGALTAMHQQKELMVVTDPKAFGVDLAKQMPDPKAVPSIVEKCLAEIELRGLEEVGIYRVSGAAADVSRLRTLFNADPEAVDLGSGGFHDINVVSGVIKQFLRELPEPLMTFNLYDGFINAASIDDYDERLWAIKDLVHALPTTNYTVLKRLVEHLERVTDYEEINHMYGTNLALVFGPSLLRPPPGSSSFALAMSNLGHAQSVIKNLILQYHWIFNVEEEAEPIEDAELAQGSSAEAETDAETDALPDEADVADAIANSAAAADSADAKEEKDGDDDDDVPLSGLSVHIDVDKRNSLVQQPPLSPATQADMDQLAMAVNKLSV
ncbi:hypothetical protein H4R24_003336 [Coemansia sp. RSA 988]|nr:hypothetical protein H4R24_003336 [Coemansia sp. RSA 988]